MCSGGGDSSARAAQQARDDEKDRQKKLKAGMEAINAAYGSGSGYNSRTVTQAPKVTTKTTGSERYSGVGRPGASLGSSLVTTTTESEQPAVTANIKGGGGFNDAFYEGRSKAYSDYYTPQVEKQYGDARQQILYGLARSGLIKSSAGAQTFGDLSEQRGLRLNEVASNAQDYAQQTRKDVEASKAAVISQLYATQDPAAAAQSAVTNANLLATSEPKFSPLADLFGGVSSIAAQNINARNYDTGAGIRPSIFNKGYTGSSTSTNGSGRLVT